MQLEGRIRNGKWEDGVFHEAERRSNGHQNGDEVRTQIPAMEAILRSRRIKASFMRVEKRGVFKDSAQRTLAPTENDTFGRFGPEPKEDRYYRTEEGQSRKYTELCKMIKRNQSGSRDAALSGRRRTLRATYCL